ncbi:MAG TPA: amino acid ABC transporter substrate-binding protein [Methylomirabilota bacterium]|nr:amino acid ABC transporter substrate-binding protein [Methylomirabilota bacterium]
MNALGRILTAAALVFLLPSPAPTQELQGTLKKIKDSGTIAIGYREQSVPFSFKGGDGKPAGYSVELCQRIVTGVQQQLKLTKLDVKWVPVTPETRIGAVVNGTIDLECGSTTNTLSRQEQVDFSHMTFVDGSSLLIKADRVAGMQDLSGKKIAVIPGTTTEPAVRAALQKSFVTAQIVPVRDHREGLAAVESGSADAYASDRVILVGLVVTAKEGQFAIGEQYLSYEPYGFMLRRGDSAFRLAVNRVLSSLYRSREISQIYARWFGKLGEPGNLLIAMYALHALPE